MTAHQRDGALAQRLRKIASHIHVGDEKVCFCSEFRSYVPIGNICANGCTHVHDGPHFASRHGKGHNIGTMVVNHSIHIGAGFKNGAVNETLRIGLSDLCSNDFTT